jgi:methylthioribose-1-phosphate isomerase
VNVNGKQYRTIWINEDGGVGIIDQCRLPHEFATLAIPTAAHMVRAIQEMRLRGAGLIGAAAAYGMYLAAREACAQRDPSGFFLFLQKYAALLEASRPTAKNLAWALAKMEDAITLGKSYAQLAEAQASLHAAEAHADWREGSLARARAEAERIADEDAEFCRRMGEHGAALIRTIAESKKGGRVNILTHCNAGWLAFVDYGSALSPVYAAHNAGIDLHVWVDETRPRNQGASLTAWELGGHGVPHTLIADNTGGHLMQHGKVDIVFVGSDRTAANGDVANKIGTYLKALAAYDNAIPFYAVLPSSSIDWELDDGVRTIPIEERDENEIHLISGYDEQEKKVRAVRISPAGTRAANYGFDVTPARLVTGIITERGIAQASREGLLALYPEKRGRDGR